MRRLPAASIDLILSDPPYGVTDCKWDCVIDPAKLWEHYRRLLKPSGVVALFAQQPFASALVNAAPRGWFRYEWIWDKVMVTGAGNAKKRPMRRHESVLVFSPRTPAYRVFGLKPCARVKRRKPDTEVYGGFREGPHVTRLTGWPQSILRFHSRGPGNPVAPCVKPVALLEFLIRTYAADNAVVLDNFMGLGSTGVAAVKMGRKFIGMELDRARFRTAKKRILETNESIDLLAA